MIDLNFLEKLIYPLAAYLVLTATPGPSNLAIMDLSLRKGRNDALVFAAGILIGSQFWGVAAAFGVASLFENYPNFINILGVCGGGYFFWLGLKSFECSLLGVSSKGNPETTFKGIVKTFISGLIVHLFNPKAIFGWVSIISLGLANKDKVSENFPIFIVVCCVLPGLLVFGGYALLFSTNRFKKVYDNNLKTVQGFIAVFFGFIGCMLLIEYLPNFL